MSCCLQSAQAHIVCTVRFASWVIALVCDEVSSWSFHPIHPIDSKGSGVVGSGAQGARRRVTCGADVFSAHPPPTAVTPPLLHRCAPHHPPLLECLAWSNIVCTCAITIIVRASPHSFEAEATNKIKTTTRGRRTLMRCGAVQV